MVTMCGAPSEYRLKKGRTRFPQPVCQRIHARGNDLDDDTAPVILSGPFATSLVNVPLSSAPGSVGQDLVGSI